MFCDIDPPDIDRAEWPDRGPLPCPACGGPMPRGARCCGAEECGAWIDRCDALEADIASPMSTRIEKIDGLDEPFDNEPIAAE